MEVAAERLLRNEVGIVREATNTLFFSLHLGNLVSQFLGASGGNNGKSYWMVVLIVRAKKETIR